MSITITVPNDDHVALRAMAKALEEIAVVRGAPEQSTQIGELNYKINLDTTQATAALEELVKQAEVDTTAQQVESLVENTFLEILKNTKNVKIPHSDEAHPIFKDATTRIMQRLVKEAEMSDSTDTPWDERIHSASKALNSDGTWRLRRKPADKTPEEWTAYVKWVEEDIHLVQSLQSDDIDPEHYVAENTEDLCVDEGCDHHGTPHVCITPEPSVTPPGDDFHVDAGEVTEQQIAAIPVPPLPVPPAPESITETQSTMSFPDVMKFLTERHARISNEQVTEIITAMGLKSIMDLNTQPEHTGPFIARVKALLGE